MQPVERCDVLIIGGGIAGLSAAIWSRRLGLSVILLEQKESVGGQLLTIGHPVTDYPGVEPTGGSALAARLRQQAQAAAATIYANEPAKELDLGSMTCMTEQRRLQPRSIILATGILPRRLGLPGEEELIRNGLVRRPSQELQWFAHKEVAVIGGGDRAVENALMLSPVASKIWLLHRSSSLRARKLLAHQLPSHQNIKVVLDAPVTDLLPPYDQVRLVHTDAGRQRILKADALCVYIGNRPNIDLVRGQVTLTPEGFVMTNSNGQTSAPGVYAVGDLCTPPKYHSLVSAAGQAMVSAKHAALTLEGRS